MKHILSMLWLMSLLLGSSRLMAQSTTINGTVVDDAGEGLPGVNVLVKGTTTGTVTNVDGTYTINVPSSADTLVYSSIGYVSEEVAINNQATIDLAMLPDIKSLQEVVVVGYGTQERKDLTGSIASVSSEEIQKVPITTVNQALQGRAAGVQVTQNDGRPGGGVSVKIRGIGTFGNNNPLYVVDGYPISGGLENLNPNDIETMDVLKDASAVAIYGSRAANGVVMITTKRGKEGKAQVTFDSYVGIQTKPDFFDVMNARQFATLANEVGMAQDVPVLPEWSNPESLRNINWQEELYRNAPQQSYNLSVRGGSEKTQAALSLGYFDQDGIVRKSFFKRYTATLNVDHQIANRLKVGTSMKYTYSRDRNRFGAGVGSLGRLSELLPTMTGNPLTDQVKDENGVYGYYPAGNIAGFDAVNPVADIETNDDKNGNNQFLGTAFAELEIIDGLKVKTNLGYNLRSYSGWSFYPAHNRSNGRPQTEYYQNANTTEEWLWENTISYDKTIGIHTFSVVGGVSAQENLYRFLNGSGKGYPSDELRSIAGAEAVTVDGSEQIWSLYSQFGRVNYKLLDRYIITGTIRRDGSSRFASGNQYGIFPSFSAAWRLSDERFMRGINFLSDLKLRGGWGEVGNQNIGLFRYLNTYSAGSITQDAGYPFGGVIVPGLAPQGLPNPNLQWETTTQTNFGVDASFLEGKINLSVDYYNKKSGDLLLDVPLSTLTGFKSAAVNAGSIVNKGLEFVLGYQHAEGDFQWGVNANLTTVNNEITALAEGLSNIGNSNIGLPGFATTDGWNTFSRSEVGGEVGAFYGYVSDGIFQTQEEIDALNPEEVESGAIVYYQYSGTSAGDRKFKDISGPNGAPDGVITEDDRTIIGSPIPDFYYGISFNASYSDFDLSLFFNGSQGNEILNYQKKNLESIGVTGGSLGYSNASVEYVNNRWTGEGTTNTYSRAVIKDVNGNSRVSDYFVEDGSFLRLKNIQLGYTLPRDLMSKIFLQSARVYIAGTNLLTFTKYSGWDPEIGEVSGVTATGVDVGAYPVARTFTVGVNLQF